MADFISEAVDSVLAQSYSDRELIVVDDGSTDNTKDVLREYIKKRLITYYYQKNGGQGLAMNKGIRKSDGECIAFLDADDTWIDKNKLAKQVDFLCSNPAYGMVGTNEVVVDKEGKTIGRIDYKLLDDEIRSEILRANQFNQSSVMFKREIIKKVGYYNPDYIPVDYDLWLRIGKKYKFCNLPEHSVTRRMLATSLSSKRGMRQRWDIFTLVMKHGKDYPGNQIKNMCVAFVMVFVPRSIVMVKKKIFNLH